MSILVQPEGSHAAPRLYARFFRRYQAVVVDSAVYAASLVALVVLTELATGSRVGTRTIGLSWVGFFLLYEPILVAWRGATLGHAYANIRVVDLHTGANPGFLRALGRFWIKALLGLFAFVFMASTRHHQALHDLLFRTVVQIRDPARASQHDYVAERIPASDVLPAPAWRRVLIIVCYSAGLFLLYLLVLVATESPECVEQNRCSAGEHIWLIVLTLLWIGAQVACLAYGWRGRLLGARTRRAMAMVATAPGAGPPDQGM